MTKAISGWRYGTQSAALLALAFGLSACGGGSSGSSSGPILSTPTPTPTQTATPTPTPTPSPTATIAPAQLTQTQARIGTCVNMANHLEATPTEGAWGRAINDRDFAEIAAQGFETVRLPVRWSAHASATPPYTIDAAWMTRVETVVAQAHAAGLRVILNDHHYDQLFITPAAERARYVAIWKQVAERFRNADNNLLWFELLNEPHNQITDANLLSILEPALAEVRATNPTRPVVVGGQNYSGINSLSTLPLPNDPYLVATFHFYDPFPFTHQGAPWVANTPPVGTTYGTPADQRELAGAVQKAQDFMARTGRPLFMGEYGAYEIIPMDQRVAYYSAVSKAFNDAGIDGCIWGYTNSFGFRDQNTGAWYTQLLRAIGL